MSPSGATRPVPGPGLLREGETCWRVVRASRLTPLVDGEAYFSALADALERACHSVWLIGWDFHTSVHLRRVPSEETELADLLDARVRACRSLHVRVLAWDFAMLYAFRRQPLPLLQFGVRTHRRVHFAMDAAHPTGASQHQKLAVIDDAVAFAGGFDLTAYRWDTREHLPHDPRRVTPWGRPYRPFHDVQLVVSGEAAAALGDLARERWRRATGRRVTPAPTSPSEPWPEKVEPLVRDVAVGIARTHPSYGPAPEIREVEALYRESIAAARHVIYIENQYLTAARVMDWLAARLREPDGPEVVIVGPRVNFGWLEERTMGTLRDHFVRQLRRSDARDALRVLYPHRAGLSPEQSINVHSKVMVIDDVLLRVGSANLSNRSLGLDAECDLAIEAGDRDDVRSSIRAFRDDLLAEHLGTSRERVAAEIERAGSVVRALDGLCGDGRERTLRPIEIETHALEAQALETLGAVDPEHPVPLQELVARFSEEKGGAPRGGALGAARSRFWRRGIVALLVVAGLLYVWSATPMREWVHAEQLASALRALQAPWYGPLLATGIFVVLCMLLVPVTALTVASGLALGPFVGVPVAWAGSVIAAAIGHGLGSVLWRDTVRRLAGDRLNTLSERLARRGIVSSAILRLIPVAPFMIVNLVAGASHVRARDFVLGTALGMLPGIVLLIVAADRTAALLEEPSGPVWLWATLAVLALLGVGSVLQRMAPHIARLVEGTPRSPT